MTGMRWNEQVLTGGKRDFRRCRIISILFALTISWGFSESGKYLFNSRGIMGFFKSFNTNLYNEFANKGLWFDYNRYCKPYITDNILENIFGEEASWVKSNCLQIEDGWICA